MTTPTPGTFITSASISDTTAPEGPATSLRRDAITHLYIVSEYRWDGYNEDQTLAVNFRYVNAVYAGGDGGGVRVAEFDDLSDANDYIRNDPDGYFS